MNKDPITGKETHITFENLADSIKEFSSIISSALLTIFLNLS